MQSKKKILIRLEHEVFEKYDLLARYKDITIDEVINKVLKEYFDIANILLEKKMDEDVSIRFSLAQGLPEGILKKLFNK